MGAFCALTAFSYIGLERYGTQLRLGMQYKPVRIPAAALLGGLTAYLLNHLMLRGVLEAELSSAGLNKYRWLDTSRQ